MHDYGYSTEELCKYLKLGKKDVDELMNCPWRMSIEQLAAIAQLLSVGVADVLWLVMYDYHACKHTKAGVVAALNIESEKLEAFR